MRVLMDCWFSSAFLETIPSIFLRLCCTRFFLARNLIYSLNLFIPIIILEEKI